MAEPTELVPNRNALIAHEVVSYLIVTYGLEYDPNTGLIKATVFKEIPPSNEAVEEDPGRYTQKVEIEGTLSQILSDERFRVPNPEVAEADLAFELGFLFGRDEKKGENA